MKKMRTLAIVVALLAVVWYGNGALKLKRDLAPYTFSPSIAQGVQDESLLEVTIANKGVQRAIVGEHIEDTLQADIEIIYQEAKELKEEIGDSALLPHRYDVVIKEYSTDPYYSALLERQEFTGGAHTNYRYQHYNFKKNKKLSLKGALKELNIKDYELYNFLRDELTKDGHTVINSVSEIRHWLIIPDQTGAPTLQILFAPHEVAPFAAGTITYTYPLQ